MAWLNKLKKGAAGVADFASQKADAYREYKEKSDERKLQNLAREEKLLKAQYKVDKLKAKSAAMKPKKKDPWEDWPF